MTRLRRITDDGAAHRARRETVQEALADAPWREVVSWRVAIFANIGKARRVHVVLLSCGHEVQQQFRHASGHLRCLRCRSAQGANGESGSDG